MPLLFTDDGDIVQWKIEQATRRNQIHKTCIKHNITTSVTNINQEVTRFIRVDNKHKVLICTIPKAGCTSWKALLVFLQHGDRELMSKQSSYLGKDIHPPSYLKAQGIHTLTDYPMEKISMMLSSYTKIIAVRDPVDRLLSAYRDKLQLRVTDKNKTKCQYCKRMGKEIMRQYRKNATKYQLDTGRFVTKLEFFRYLTERPPYGLNNHFRTYQDLCHPCTIQYDYIIKMETSDQDSNILIPLVFNSTEKLPVYHQSSKGGTSLDTENQLSNLTLKERNGFLDSYAFDFESFGYTIPGDGI